MSGETTDKKQVQDREQQHFGLAKGRWPTKERRMFLGCVIRRVQSQSHGGQENRASSKRRKAPSDSSVAGG